MIFAANKKVDKSEDKGHKKNDSNEESIPHTINQIYDMCKSYDYKDTFNYQEIGQILVDARSMYMYPKGVYGYRLVEAKCRKRLYQDKSLFLVSSISGNEYEFELRCKNNDLFSEIRDLLFYNRDKVIVVAGHWEKSGVFNRFSTTFNSKRQIKVLKQKI